MPVAATMLGAGVVGILVARWRRTAETLCHGAMLGLLSLTLLIAPHTAWWLAAVVVPGLLGTTWVALRRQRAVAAQAESLREESASQLDRRISELFSLQELSYVLSESIQVERIVEQVARYASRFLQAEGAMVVLRESGSRTLRVSAADGTLESLQGQLVEPDADRLVTLAIERDRIEVAQGMAVPSVKLVGELVVRSAAVAPLRAHGVTMGALAVVDREHGAFTTEDLWLLSTVATQASVVLANGRLYEMVRRSKEEWETAFNALTEGIAVIDPAGLLTRSNRALAQLLDESEDALLGRDFCEIFFGDLQTPRELIAASRSGERRAPLIVRSDPTRRVLRLTAAPLAARDENAAVVVLVEDVTEQRSLEAQLIQNEKMAAIGQLVSGVAHELNNPLTSIAGLTELLLERGAPAENPREHLRVIHEQAERAGRIVRNLLTFARTGAPEKEAVDLNDVVARTALLIMYELKLRGIELETRLSSDTVMVMGDRYELQQVLLNLVTNAAQAVGELAPDRPRLVSVETSRLDDRALLRVSDTGPGIPPALVSYLFTPFFTTKGPGQGTGLGLSLSYGLIESHGGRLTYEPSPLGGAEFSISLPRLDTAPAEEAVATVGPTPDPGATASSNGGSAGRRILVVDDDPAIHRLVSALFTPEGHHVEMTRSGTNALRLLEDGDYAIVIADAQLPAADELFVTAYLARHADRRDRLVVAAPAQGPDVAALFPGEPLRQLAKPVNLRALRTLAAEMFGRVPDTA